MNFESGTPAVLGLEFSHDIVGACSAALPTAAIHHGLAFLYETRVRKDQGLVLNRYRPAAKTAVAFNVEIFQSLGGRIPKVNRLPQCIRLAFCVHSMSIAQEFA